MLLVGGGRNAILVCTLDITRFADFCCPVGAYRHLIPLIGCCLLCSLLLPGCGISPFYSAHWRLFALRSVVVRWWRNAILVCALDIVCFADCCCSVVAERHFHFAHWKFCASQSLVARWWQNAILVCALDIVCFADCCCPVMAYRHFVLRIGHYSLRELL